MSIEEQHVALPKLCGQPAYARPARPVEVQARPLDPDDLPLEVHQTDEERRYTETARTAPYLSVAPGDGSHAGAAPALRPRPFRLRALGRLLGGDG